MSTEVFIVSKEKILAEHLANYFRALGCGVDTSNNARSVNQNTKHLIVVNMGNAFSKDRLLADRIKKYSPKTVVVSDVWSADVLVEGVGLKQIFIDQLMPYTANVLSQIYSESKKSHVFVPADAWVSISTVDQLTGKVASELFSFPMQKKILFGKLVSFREVILHLNPNATISINKNSLKRLPRRDLEVVETAIDIKALLWKESFSPKPKINQNHFKIRIPKIKITAPKAVGRFSVVMAATILIVLVVPYALLFGASGSTFMAYKLFQNEDISASTRALHISSKLASLSSKMFNSYGFLPLRREAGILALGTGAAGRVLSASDYATELSEESINKLHLDLVSLYRDLSFIDGEVKNSPLLVSDMFPEVEKIGEYRDYVLAASKISAELPSILGFDRPKTYMVLFQNNMELRPTGGFIGSFALLTVSKGEIVDDTVYDVYSADGQLKGYVEPPLPIKEHLGEASWTLRDSNWDPSFPVSAASAEWFLDKSMDRQVDGVIGINLETAKEILKVLGPVQLPGFGDTIDHKNMYEKVQFEVEDNFFPGSRKKAQYLSALSEALLSRIENANPKEYVKLLAASVRKLGSRDIQMYLHDEKVKNVLAEQGWQGALPQGNFSGIVEANLGVNKANYFITREVNVNIALNEEFFTEEISLKLKNSAPTRDKIPEQRYKAYIRALSPSVSGLVGAEILSQEGKKAASVDITHNGTSTEYGTLVEVLPGEEKIVTFKIKTKLAQNFAKDSSFSYTWWKQSGTGEYPFAINITAPKMSGTKWDPPFRLTEQGAYRYNTNLVDDFILNLNWTSK